MNIFAAGIMFRKGRRIFLVQRSDDLTWAVPGGTIEEGELPQDAAVREVQEEVGYNWDLPLTPYSLHNGYLTYLAECKEEFVPQLDGTECMAGGWFDLDELPEQIHPGLLLSLGHAPLTEKDVSELIADGSLSSPQYFRNMFLWAIRVSGTGVTWRSADNSFTYRNPGDYLTPKFLERIAGTPVIMDHPEKNTLDSDEFDKRVIGTLGSTNYVVGDEAWSIARIYNMQAAMLMFDKQLSTSPTVCLDIGRSDKILVDGEPLLVEDSPVLLDHVAICGVGVWDKHVNPTGVKTDSLKEVPAMDEEKIKQFVADCVDAAFAKADADREAREEQAKADAEDKANADEKAKADAAEKADAEAKEAKAKADADEKAEKEKSDADERAEKADATIQALAAELALIKSRIPTELSDADRNAVSDAVVKADSVFAAFGERAPVALSGENANGYRKRVLNSLKKHSKAFQATDMSAIADSAMLDLVETSIFADAQSAARSGDAVTGALREVTNRDRAGRLVSTFAGDIAQTFAPFSAPARRVSMINN